MPCVFINDSSECYPIQSTDDGNTIERPNVTPDSLYVELKPYHLNSIHLTLFWTPYFGADVLTHKRASLLSSLFGSKGQTNGKSGNFYRPRRCYRQYPRCIVTTNRNCLHAARSILFHWRDLDPTDLPPTRTVSQLWTLYNLEAPPNANRLPITGDDNVLSFNLTATYRYDSDIVIPYGRIVPKSTVDNVNVMKNVSALAVQWEAKTRSVAWFVSNCHAPNHREDFVRQLSRYISVDIYGKCGTFSCQPQNSDDCYRKVANEYLFYLSFENSICT